MKTTPFDERTIQFDTSNAPSLDTARTAQVTLTGNTLQIQHPLTEAKRRFAIGEEIHDYHLVRPLGVGGMGEVWLAQETGDSGLERLVAMKFVIKPSDEAVELMVQEAKTQASVGTHNNIVNIYAFQRSTNGEPTYLVQEYIDGETLDDIIEGNHNLDSSDILNIMVQTGRALRFVGKKDLVHLDIKGANFMVRNNSDVLLTDWGIACSPETADQTRKNGTVAGTLPYMSPEQLGNLTYPLDHRTDLYSLGIMFYEFVAGKLPWKATTWPEYVREITVVGAAPPTETATLPTYTWNDIRPTQFVEKFEKRRRLAHDHTTLCAAITRCTQKDPADRFANADALLSFINERRRCFTKHFEWGKRAVIGLTGALGVAYLGGLAVLNPTNTDAAQTQMERATRLYTAEDYAGAEKAYGAALDRINWMVPPSFDATTKKIQFEATLQRMRALSDGGHAEEAATLARTLATARIPDNLPGFITPAYVQAEVARAQGNEEEALSTLEELWTETRIPEYAAALGKIYRGKAEDGSRSDRQKLKRVIGELQGWVATFKEQERADGIPVWKANRPQDSMLWEVAALSLESNVYRIQGTNADLTTALTLNEQALRIVDNRDNHHLLGKLWNYRGIIYMDLEQLAEAKDAFDQAITILDKKNGGSNSRLAASYGGRAAAFDLLGKFAEAEADYATADALYRAVGNIDRSLDVRVNALWVTIKRGAYERAQNTAAEMIATAQKDTERYKGNLQDLSRVVLEAHAMEGNIEHAERELERMRALYNTTPKNNVYFAEALLKCADAQFLQGNTTRASELLTTLHGGSVQEDAYTMVLAHALRAQIDGERMTTEERATTITSLHKYSAEVNEYPTVYSQGLAAIALLHAQQGAYDRAATIGQQALDVATFLDAPYNQARIAHTVATALDASPEHQEEAAQLKQRVSELAQTHGFHGLHP